MAVAAGTMAAVESANTVGYLNRELEGEEWMLNLGACFENMATPDGSFVVSNMLFGTEVSEFDKIYLFNGDEWDLDIYEYNGAGNGWSLAAADGSFSNVDSFTIPVGAHVSYEPYSNDAVKIAGQVAASGSTTVSFEITDSDWMFNLVNPYPIDTTFGDLETFAGEFDKIYIFNGDEWDLDIYEYNGTGNGWSLAAADGSFSTITDSSAVIIPAGQGAYYEPYDSREWTVTLNY